MSEKELSEKVDRVIGLMTICQPVLVAAMRCPLLVHECSSKLPSHQRLAGLVFLRDLYRILGRNDNNNNNQPGTSGSVAAGGGTGKLLQPPPQKSPAVGSSMMTPTAASVTPTARGEAKSPSPLSFSLDTADQQHAASFYEEEEEEKRKKKKKQQQENQKQQEKEEGESRGGRSPSPQQQQQQQRQPNPLHLIDLSNASPLFVSFRNALLGTQTSIPPPDQDEAFGRARLTNVTGLLHGNTAPLRQLLLKTPILLKWLSSTLLVERYHQLALKKESANVIEGSESGDPSSLASSVSSSAAGPSSTASPPTTAAAAQLAASLNFGFSVLPPTQEDLALFAFSDDEDPTDEDDDENEQEEGENDKENTNDNNNKRGRRGRNAKITTALTNYSTKRNFLVAGKLTNRIRPTQLEFTPILPPKSTMSPAAAAAAAAAAASGGGAEGKSTSNNNNANEKKKSNNNLSASSPTSPRESNIVVSAAASLLPSSPASSPSSSLNTFESNQSPASSCLSPMEGSRPGGEVNSSNSNNNNNKRSRFYSLSPDAALAAQSHAEIHNFLLEYPQFAVFKELRVTARDALFSLNTMWCMTHPCVDEDVCCFEDSYSAYSIRERERREEQQQQEGEKEKKGGEEQEAESSSAASSSSSKIHVGISTTMRRGGRRRRYPLPENLTDSIPASFASASDDCVCSILEDEDFHLWQNTEAQAKYERANALASMPTTAYQNKSSSGGGGASDDSYFPHLRRVIRDKTVLESACQLSAEKPLEDRIRFLLEINLALQNHIVPEEIWRSILRVLDKTTMHLRKSRPTFEMAAVQKDKLGASSVEAVDRSIGRITIPTPSMKPAELGIRIADFMTLVLQDFTLVADKHNCHEILSSGPAGDASGSESEIKMALRQTVSVVKWAVREVHRLADEAKTLQKEKGVNCSSPPPPSSATSAAAAS